MRRLRPRRPLSLRRPLTRHSVPIPPQRPTSALPRAVAATALAALLAACASAGPTPATSDAQLLAPPKDSCQLAREDAVANPRLDVERVPAPVAMKPAPIKSPVPRTVLRASKGTEIRAEVLVDTLGKPDMATFTMLATPHAWYATNLKAAVAQWSFEPALRNGCKVPRYYQFMVDLRPRRAR